jgi:quinol monooxygenase YgiN
MPPFLFMSQPAVSLHPYFKVHPGKLAEARALLPQFIARTASEPACLDYGFTSNGDEVFCRESYTDADATLAHLTNVNELLGQMLKVSDLVRLELHGPAAELEKLKAPLADLKPAWFVCECELRR